MSATTVCDIMIGVGITLILWSGLRMAIGYLEKWRDRL